MEDLEQHTKHFSSCFLVLANVFKMNITVSPEKKLFEWSGLGGAEPQTETQVHFISDTVA